MNVLQVKTLPSNQKQTTEQARFICPPLGESFEKQTKTKTEKKK